MATNEITIPGINLKVPVSWLLIGGGALVVLLLFGNKEETPEDNSSGLDTNALLLMELAQLRALYNNMVTTPPGPVPVSPPAPPFPGWEWIMPPEGGIPYWEAPPLDPGQVVPLPGPPHGAPPPPPPPAPGPGDVTGGPGSMVDVLEGPVIRPGAFTSLRLPRRLSSGRVQ